MVPSVYFQIRKSGISPIDLTCRNTSRNNRRHLHLGGPHLAGATLRRIVEVFDISVGMPLEHASIIDDVR